MFYLSLDEIDSGRNWVVTFVDLFTKEESSAAIGEETMDPTAGLDVALKNRIFCSCWESNLGCLARNSHYNLEISIFRTGLI